MIVQFPGSNCTICPLKILWNFFGQFVWIEKKSHYYSRVSFHEAPRKKRRKVSKFNFYSLKKLQFLDTVDPHVDLHQQGGFVHHVNEGQNVQMPCSAKCTPGCNITWYRDDVILNTSYTWGDKFYLSEHRIPQVTPQKETEGASFTQDISQRLT